MRMDLSLLLLATPLMPPIVPALGAPNGVADPCRPPPAGWVLRVCVGGVEPVCPRPPAAAPGPPCWPAPAPPGAAPTGSGRKSSFVIGSLYFLRRYRSRTRRSIFGGYALAVFRWKSAIACTY